MKIPSFLVSESLKNNLEIVQGVANVATGAAKNIKTTQEAKRLAADNPARPGMEHLFCYGTLVLHGMPTATFALVTPVEEVRGLLHNSWGINNHDEAIHTLNLVT
ncbi:hypothetical protein [Klugiella xanthotipulae]|uniref:Uncharacterized protein n=1 Tax=Klugiella xanthotipulae TaxID=244735 RepID=A0A543HXY7_9MICO|nr:hypothetical protein [Klugiella xanthotipulae]TQM63192.1 hypothetical protein FB466_1447 [Klugiella xanthotipulae]